MIYHAREEQGGEIEGGIYPLDGAQGGGAIEEGEYTKYADMTCRIPVWEGGQVVT